MNLHSIETGNFRLDGGAMFGVVPKKIWERNHKPDSHNRIKMAATSLLIEDGNRLILIDTGLGNKQPSKFFSHFGLYGDASLDKSLKEKGFQRDDITDVFFTHLHFDHCGGAIQYNNKEILEPAFKNAQFWSNKNHWEWATKPNPREKASFLSENILPIEESGQLNFLNLAADENNIVTNSPLNFGIFLADGHTEKQMIPLIQYKEQTIAFCADLIPTTSHIPLPYVMSYDTRPLETMKEKEIFLNLASANNWKLFLQHDAQTEVCTVQKTEKGIRLKETLTFNEI